MKTSVLDDLKAIANRHRELHPKSVADPKPVPDVEELLPPPTPGWRFKSPHSRLLMRKDLWTQVVLLYKGKRYGYDGSYWWEIED